MPRYAVLSDIHGNLEAFEAVLGFCEGAHIDKYILLGDVVGYNADPVRCVEIARNLNLAGLLLPSVRIFQWKNNPNRRTTHTTKQLLPHIYSVLRTS